MGYHRAGFELVGVDHEPQPNYPFKFVQADAVEFLIRHGREFDAVHCSPPCQRYSLLTQGTNARLTAKYPDLISSTREVLDPLGKPYVIENVPGAPVREDLLLCGLSFGLNVFRHRRFEVGRWRVVRTDHPSHRGHRVAGWRHGTKYDGDMVAVYGDGGGKGTVADWQRAIGIDWTEIRREIAEAIPPSYSEFIGRQLLAFLM